MEITFFIGCDVSKNELDFAVREGKELLFHKEINNKTNSISSFVKELKSLPGFDLTKAIFCMEHTGIYNNLLLTFLYKKNANICIEAASQIKNSLGNIRGKNDKIDAIRIAEYAYKNREELRLWKPKREVIQQLAHLTSTRSRLLDAQKLLTVPLKEKNTFIKKSMVNQNTSLCITTLASLKKDIEKAEKAIEEVIESDDELRRLFKLITSVSGIGKVTATRILITTNEFKDIKDPKKFACYSGVAPFKKESGIFKGKARVSHMANKKMKTLLHMSAITAIRSNGDIKLYYARKVEENKSKMSIINAIRNKLILRIFACVNQNREYEKEYIRTVA
jgi:transposase